MNIVADIKQLIEESRRQIYQNLNIAMVQTYWLIGKRIVKEDQQGEARAAYGKALLKNLSVELQKEFGKGFSVDNLQNMRQFYLHYPLIEQKYETPSRILQVPNFLLSWSHYLFLLAIENTQERAFYEIESTANCWSLRELKRQYDSGLYLRLALSINKTDINQLSQKGQVIEKVSDAIKEPYILEFLGLEENHRYSETELENALIDKLEYFLLELGKGFTFVARQKRITFDEKHFRIDLVFYNRLLKCFVLIDLKIGELHHQDIGQMQMYVNYYDRKVKLPKENKTIGIILCKEENKTVIEFTLPEKNKQIFAKEYKAILPSKAALAKQLQ
jgi:predicted nuclease of restriction endonuclease-like (RecB) superfamily